MFNVCPAGTSIVPRTAGVGGVDVGRVDVGGVDVGGVDVGAVGVIGVGAGVVVLGGAAPVVTVPMRNARIVLVSTTLIVWSCRTISW
jgi:hypothetical protein